MLLFFSYLFSQRSQESLRVLAVEPLVDSSVSAARTKARRQSHRPEVIAQDETTHPEDAMTNSRRHFLKGSSLALLGAAAGCGRKQCKTPPNSPPALPPPSAPHPPRPRSLFLHIRGRRKTRPGGTHRPRTRPGRRQLARQHGRPLRTPRRPAQILTRIRQPLRTRAGIQFSPAKIPAPQKIISP